MAYISDVVLDINGNALPGASVTLLRASDYASPPLTDPGPGTQNYIAQTTASATGQFVFDHIPVDDYHLMVKAAGQTTFRYHVPALPVEAARVKEADGRSLIPITLEKILSGQNTTIHCVGDSITVGYNSTGTVGGGFVQRLGVLIAQQLAPLAAVQRYDPNAYGALQDGPITGWNGPTTIQSPSGGSTQVIEIVNNGVSGDTVQRVLRRYNNLTGWSPNIDLFIVYLGINDSVTNDSSKFVPPDAFYAGLTSLANFLRTYYPEAEVALCSPHHNDQPDVGNGGTIPAGTYTLEQYASATRRVAIEQGVALVDLRTSWADQYNASDPNFAGDDGYGPWLSTAGGNHTHPTDLGHQAIAEEIFKLFGTPGLSAGRMQRLQTVGPRRHFKELEVVRNPNNHPALVYGGGHWSTYNPALLSSLYYSASLKKSSTANDTIIWYAPCQDFAILTRRGRDCGQFTITIDSGSPTTFDNYRAFLFNDTETTEDGAVYPSEKLWVARGLSEGWHQIALTVLGTKNPASSAANIYFDGIEYTRRSEERRVGK